MVSRPTGAVGPVGRLRLGQECLPRLLVRPVRGRQRPHHEHSHRRTGEESYLDRFPTRADAASTAGTTRTGFLLRNQPGWMPLLRPIWTGFIARLQIPHSVPRTGVSRWHLYRLSASLQQHAHRPAAPVAAATSETRFGRCTFVIASAESASATCHTREPSEDARRSRPGSSPVRVAANWDDNGTSVKDGHES
jgi:hypothetical protein